ncbi:MULTISPECIES: protein kinase domain-containing protein [Dermacoccus]|uniref:protein kinase domain-containing protein n=1 Tax=Dermacoccus TaxID=57495 RepID=UPI0013EBCF41|nr:MULTISPECIES: protein kinase [Dermacoccus]MBE7372012.1 protein kinase [Dermacoccus barathri]
MADSLTTTPTTFRALTNEFALKARPIVLVVGAGVSKGIGLPLWGSLRDQVCDCLLGAALPGAESEAKRHLLESAKCEDDLWVAFERMSEAGGRPEFSSAIKSILKVDGNSSFGLYEDLWRLPIAGIVNLNIDEAAHFAYAKARSGAAPAHYHVGAEVEGLAHNVGEGGRPFLWQLHGALENDKSWVMTRADLERRLKNVEVASTIRDIFDRSTVVFIGVGPQDEAIAAVLKALKSEGRRYEDRYWVTDHVDLQSSKWAEENDVRVVGYSAGRHGDLLQMVRVFSRAQPADRTLSPDFKSFGGRIRLPESADEAAGMDEDDLRGALNEKALEIVGRSGLSDEFYEFLEKYDRSIYKSWYLPAKVRDYPFMGYELQDDGRAGAFGRVFPALDENKQIYAVKILREEQRSNIDMMVAFRRGVQAMKILTAYGIPGMVRYVESSEIPAMVVMDYIHGSTLAEVVENRLVTEWQDVLSLGSRLAEIIESAHGLKERVIHRDIRPGNVMISSPWEKTSWEVTVLDFDLSTYVRADDRTFLADKSTGPTSYLAPEQLSRERSAEAKNALVDSFGVGMTLYYLCSQREPARYDPVEFEKEVFRACRVFPSSKWRSLPVRYARLINSCIANDQRRRPTMSYIRAELKALEEAHLDPDLVEDANLLVDELVARCDPISERDFTLLEGGVEVRLVSGVKCQIRVVSRAAIEVVLEWAADASVAFSSRNGVHEKWTSELKRGGWVVSRASGAGGAAHVVASTAPSPRAGELDRLAEALGNAIDATPAY